MFKVFFCMFKVFSCMFKGFSCMFKAVFCMFKEILQRFIFLPERSPKMIGKCAKNNKKWPILNTCPPSPHPPGHVFRIGNFLMRLVHVPIMLGDFSGRKLNLGRTSLNIQKNKHTTKSLKHTKNYLKHTALNIFSDYFFDTTE